MSNEAMRKEFIESQMRKKSPKEKRAIGERSSSYYYKKQYDFEKKRYGRRLLQKRLQQLNKKE